MDGQECLESQKYFVNYMILNRMSGDMNRLGRIAGLLLLFMASSLAWAEAETSPQRQVVYGAGPSTKLVQLFFEHFSKQPDASDYSFTVPSRSTKHIGGIRSSTAFLFGRTGRPLSPSEKRLNKGEIFLGQVKVGYATGAGVSIPTISTQQLEKVLRGEIGNWSELGGPNKPIDVVGREKSEAVLTAVSKVLPFHNGIEYRKIFKRDHTLVNFLKSPAGRYAIGLGALANFSELHSVQLTDVELGVPLGLVYDRDNESHPIITAVKSYVMTPEWKRIVADHGFIPIEEQHL